MTLLKLFYFSLCQKKQSTGKLRLSQVSRIDSHGWNKKILTSKKSFGTFMTLIKFFYFTNFSLFQLKKRSTGELRLSYVSRFDSHGWN